MSVPLTDLCEATEFAQAIERVLDDPTSRPHRLARVARLHGVESLHVDAPGLDQSAAFISGVRIRRTASLLEQSLAELAKLRFDLIDGHRGPGRCPGSSSRSRARGNTVAAIATCARPSSRRSSTFELPVRKSEGPQREDRVVLRREYDAVFADVEHVEPEAVGELAHGGPKMLRHRSSARRAPGTRPPAPGRASGRRPHWTSRPAVPRGNRETPSSRRPRRTHQQVIPVEQRVVESFPPRVALPRRARYCGPRSRSPGA